MIGVIVGVIVIANSCHFGIPKENFDFEERKFSSEEYEETEEEDNGQERANKKMKEKIL